MHASRFVDTASRELRPIVALAALDLLTFVGETTAGRGYVTCDSFALGFEAEAAGALLGCADPVIRMFERTRPGMRISGHGMRFAGHSLAFHNSKARVAPRYGTKRPFDEV